MSKLLPLGWLCVIVSWDSFVIGHSSLSFHRPFPEKLWSASPSRRANCDGLGTRARSFPAARAADDQPGSGMCTSVVRRPIRRGSFAISLVTFTVMPAEIDSLLLRDNPHRRRDAGPERRRDQVGRRKGFAFAHDYRAGHQSRAQFPKGHESRSNAVGRCNRSKSEPLPSINPGAEFATSCLPNDARS